MNTETIFLHNAGRLTQALASISDRLMAAGITTKDWSQLSYNYHVRSLEWRYWLIQERPQAPEINRVTVILNYCEPMDETEIPMLDLSVSAIIFQMGSCNRVAIGKDQSEKIDDQLINGLEQIVFKLFEDGWRALSANPPSFDP